MAISFSRPDPSSPSAVGAASFPVARRGFDQGEVRDFLRMVAAELSRLQERERFLESELRAMQTRGMSSPGRLDEETVTTLLGEEAARVLSTARDASTQIRERAEESATRLVKDAADDAARIRESASMEAQRIRDDAAADANAEVEMAKQQGRDMVNEAREYREKVLSELSRRRDAARNQIEQLLHGRDRLLNAFERARIASESVLNELHEAHDEPETLVNLAPTTGPIPIVNPHHPSVTAYDQAAEPQNDAATEVREAVAEAEALVAGATKVIDIPLEEILAPITDRSAVHGSGEDGDAADKTHDPADVGGAEETVLAESIESVETESIADDIMMEAEEEVVDVIAVAPGEVHDDAVDDAEDDAPVVTNVVSLFDRRPHPVPEVEATPAQADAHPVVTERAGTKPASTKADARAPKAPAGEPSVDDIFAKLRAGSTSDVAEKVVGRPAAGIPDLDVAKKAAAKKGQPAKVDGRAESEKTAKTAIEPAVDPQRFADRNEAIAPVVTQIARKFKRVLADEQNNVLEHLRGKRSSLEIDAVLGTVAEHAARYASAVSEDAMTAAGAGAKSMKDARGTSKRVTPKAVSAATAKSITEGLVAAFREDARIAIGEAEGDREILAGLMRDVYRKWKMSGIDAHVDDTACAAFNAGAYLSLEPTASIVWMVDADEPCCGDCADNSLAGAVTKGQEFPTGHSHPMAHVGCRCLIGPAAH